MEDKLQNYSTNQCQVDVKNASCQRVNGCAAALWRISYKTIVPIDIKSMLRMEVVNERMNVLERYGG